jgi:drug/metabolite transporter (DMT)-like permease
MTDGRESGAARVKVIAAFLAIYIVWGSTYLGIKVVVDTIPPLTAAGIRFVLAGIMVYGWARLRGAPPPSAKQRVNLGLLGLLMFVPGYAALFWAERSIPSGLAAVLIATLPLWTILVEAGVFKRRRVTPMLAIALATGFTGVVLLATGRSGGAARATPLLPCVAVILGEMSWAVGSVITSQLDLPTSSILTAGAEMLCGGIVLVLLGATIGEWRAIPVPTPAAIVAMAYLIFVGSIVAFTAYTWLLGRTSATRLSSFSYVNPVVALALGYEFGGERLTAHALVASLLVLVSVVLVQLATARRSVRPPEGSGRGPKTLKPLATRAAAELQVSTEPRPLAASRYRSPVGARR